MARNAPVDTWKCIIHYLEEHEVSVLRLVGQKTLFAATSGRETMNFRRWPQKGDCWPRIVVTQPNLRSLTFRYPGEWNCWDWAPLMRYELDNLPSKLVSLSLDFPFSHSPFTAAGSDVYKQQKLLDKQLPVFTSLTCRQGDALIRTSVDWVLHSNLTFAALYSGAQYDLSTCPPQLTHLIAPHTTVRFSETLDASKAPYRALKTLDVFCLQSQPPIAMPALISLSIVSIPSFWFITGLTPPLSKAYSLI